MKTPVTMKKIRQHFTYSWWKYALLAACAILGWNLIYSVTAYRPPQEKTVDLYIYGYSASDELQSYLDSIRANEMPDMEQMDAVTVAPDETYGAMILSTRMAAAEGDLYILPKELFQNYAGQGWFRPLEDIEGLVEGLEARNINLERSWRMETETKERHLYGIPLSALPGFQQYVVTEDEAWLCIFVNNQNEENAIKLLNILIRDMQEEPATLPDTP